jgi:hypothetical protein
MERANKLEDLEKMIEFLKEHPEVPLPVFYNFNAFADDKAQILEVARSGEWKKIYSGEYFTLAKNFGGINLEVSIHREAVCKRIVVGSKIIPAVPEHTVDIVEWECDKSIFESNSLREKKDNNESSKN